MIRAHDAIRIGLDFLHTFAKHIAFHLVENRIQQLSTLMERIPCAIVEPNGAIVIDQRRIKGDEFQHGAAVWIANTAIIFIVSVGGIADGNADLLAVAAHAFFARHTVIEIKPAVIALHHIGRIHIFQLFAILRVLICAVRCPFTAPTFQIVHRGGPEFIAEHTVGVTAGLIMGTEQIHSVAKHMRFPVRYIGIQG